MDLFETLLLNGSSSTAGGGGEGSGNGTDDNVAGSSGAIRNPRPSRYAQLLPNEACRIKMSSNDANNATVNGGRDVVVGRAKGDNKNAVIDEEVVDANSSNNSTEDKNNTSDATTQKNDIAAENVRVYKMDNASGTLELLPEENYDLIYYDDDSETNDGGDDKIEETDGEISDKKEGEVSNKEEGGKVDESAKEGDAMDVDDKQDENTNEQDMAIDNAVVDVGEELDDTNQDDTTTLYIIKTPSLPSMNIQPPEIDTASSSDDELLSNNYSYNNDIKSQTTLSINNNKTKQANLASSTASTLSRALVSRTSNFDKLRPSYAMLLANEQRDEQIKDQKKKEKEKE